MEFNPSVPSILHVDINSCFATIEQQANPFLRGRPVAVAAYAAPYGCILAASVEAKRMGVKTGMRVWQGKKIIPDLTVLPPDPDKYRHVHLGLKAILESYTTNCIPKSIDEFTLNLSGFPAFRRGSINVAREIKRRICKEVGEWISVSVGIGPNRFLAKTAAGLKKPDGLEVIDVTNFADVYSRLELTDLCGVAGGNARRLHIHGIYTVSDLANASVHKLKEAFHSIGGYYWFMRLRGWEIDAAEFERKSFGNSFIVPPEESDFSNALAILAKLCEKTAERMRKSGFVARGAGFSIGFRNGAGIHKSAVSNSTLLDARDIYNTLVRQMSGFSIPDASVLSVAEWVFDLSPANYFQNELFQDKIPKFSLAKAVDDINARWGQTVVGSVKGYFAGKLIKDRIAFGGVKEL